MPSMSKARARLTSLCLGVAAVSLSGCDEMCTVIGCEELPPELNQVRELFVDTYVVKLAGEPADAVQIVNELQLLVADVYEFEPIHVFQQVISGFQVKLPWAAVEALEDDLRVEYIVLDKSRAYTPPPGSKAPELSQGEIPAGIRRIGGPANFDLSSIEVAVVDTGIDLDHPELNVVGHKDLIAEAGGEDTGADDRNGHGTHVAGTIGARGDNSGVVGVAPGIGLHAVRVLDADGNGTLGDIIAGLDYVLQNPRIRVVNLSLGGTGDPAPPAPLMEAIDALDAQGVVVCVAAGNEGDNTAFYIPAGYDRGIVVSAYDAVGTDNGFADFSNFGTAVDIAAPGVDITSTLPDGQYGALSGTSMATPHVAGAVAAYFAQHSSASAAQVKAAIQASAENNIAGQGANHPEGLLDAAQLWQQ